MYFTVILSFVATLGLLGLLIALYLYLSAWQKFRATKQPGLVTLPVATPSLPVPVTPATSAATLQIFPRRNAYHRGPVFRITVGPPRATAPEPEDIPSGPKFIRPPWYSSESREQTASGSSYRRSTVQDGYVPHRYSSPKAKSPKFMPHRTEEVSSSLAANSQTDHVEHHQEEDITTGAGDLGPDNNGSWYPEHKSTAGKEPPRYSWLPESMGSGSAPVRIPKRGEHVKRTMRTAAVTKMRHNKSEVADRTTKHKITEQTSEVVDTTLIIKKRKYGNEASGTTAVSALAQGISAKQRTPMAEAVATIASRDTRFDSRETLRATILRDHVDATIPLPLRQRSPRARSARNVPFDLRSDTTQAGHRNGRIMYSHPYSVVYTHGRYSIHHMRNPRRWRIYWEGKEIPYQLSRLPYSQNFELAMDTLKPVNPYECPPSESSRDVTSYSAGDLIAFDDNASLSLPLPVINATPDPLIIEVASDMNLLPPIVEFTPAYTDEFTGLDIGRFNEDINKEPLQSREDWQAFPSLVEPPQVIYVDAGPIQSLQDTLVSPWQAQSDFEIVEPPLVFPPDFSVDALLDAYGKMLAMSGDIESIGSMPELQSQMIPCENAVASEVFQQVDISTMDGQWQPQFLDESSETALSVSVGPSPAGDSTEGFFMPTTISHDGPSFVEEVSASTSQIEMPADEGALTGSTEVPAFRPPIFASNVDLLKADNHDGALKESVIKSTPTAPITHAPSEQQNLEDIEGDPEERLRRRIAKGKGRAVDQDIVSSIEDERDLVVSLLELDKEYFTAQMLEVARMMSAQNESQELETASVAPESNVDQGRQWHQYQPESSTAPQVIDLTLELPQVQIDMKAAEESYKTLMSELEASHPSESLSPNVPNAMEDGNFGAFTPMEVDLSLLSQLEASTPIQASSTTAYSSHPWQMDDETFDMSNPLEPSDPTHWLSSPTQGGPYTSMETYNSWPQSETSIPLTTFMEGTPGL